MATSAPPSARGVGGSGSLTYRPRANASSPNGPQGLPSQNFLKLVERTTDAFVGSDDTALEDVRRTLLQVRQQYDSVHYEAEQKDARLKRVREAIRSADVLHGQRAEEAHRLDETWQSLEKQFEDTMKRIKETQTSRKVYEHMLARIQKEQAILRQKMLKMEEHVARKRREVRQRVADQERVRGERVQGVRSLDALETDAEAEREACRGARDCMDGELDRRRFANKRRADFECWRHEVALEAANEAFNASAGRLRKLYAIEKLAGNSLQKITFEQVERSQTTEDGFQKIRDVTGLADVMDIVHKFLNRDVEHEQLKGSVKDAEVRLEALRQDFDAFKRDTEGITFDHGPASNSGAIYKDIEQSERILTEAMEEHEAMRSRLQKTTLQTEHMKRWAARVGQLLSSFEEPARVEGPQDLAAFFRKLEFAIEKFISLVSQQISEGKITRKALIQVLNRENNEQQRTLSNHEFLSRNCRVPPAADAARPASRQGSAEDDPATAFMEDREKCKNDSVDYTRTAFQKAEQQKKRSKGS